MSTGSLKENWERAPEENSIPFKSAHPRVLIVDDDHSSVLTVYSMAKSFNSRVDAANGAEAGLQCLKKSTYDVVVINLEMHGFSGYELARWIRDKSPDTRVVVMSGRNHSEMNRYMNTGIVDHWISKPFGTTELLIAFDDFLSANDLADSPQAG